jgi:hypothetical protein
MPGATYPDVHAEAHVRFENRAHPYSVLLQVGLALPPSLRSGRCALTAPFHPYHPSHEARGGGLLSAALSLGLPPPVVIRHLASMEPGLSSTAPFPALPPRPPGHLIEACCRRSVDGRQVPDAGSYSADEPEGPATVEMGLERFQNITSALPIDCILICFTRTERWENIPRRLAEETLAVRGNGEGLSIG